MDNFFDLSVEELGRQMAKEDSRAFRVGQILRWVYRIGLDDFSEMTDLSVALREYMGARLNLNPMKTEDMRVAGDGTVKFLYALEDGARIETVLIPDDGHFTLCISTQAGCAMGCLFCETGRAGGGRIARLNEQRRRRPGARGRGAAGCRARPAGPAPSAGAAPGS